MENKKTNEDLSKEYDEIRKEQSEIKMELEEIKKSKVLSPRHRKARTLSYSIRIILALGFTYYFWDHKWLGWFLLAYALFNIVGLGLVLGTGYFVNKSDKILKE